MSQADAEPRRPIANLAGFAWGDEFTPSGQHLANTRQGVFPNENTCADGFALTPTVTAFPPNSHHLHDMIGDVCERTSDALNYCRRYRPGARHTEPVGTSTSHVGFRCVVRNAPVPKEYRP